MIETATKVAFPEAKSFSDLFTVAVPHVMRDKPKPEGYPEPDKFPSSDVVYPKKGNGPGRTVNYSIDIGPYCMISHRDGYKGLAVKARPEVAEYIRQNMLAPRYDSIYFSIVFQPSGEALVIAQNNQIIASRWLAYIDGRTVPGYENEPAPEPLPKVKG